MGHWALVLGCAFAVFPLASLADRGDSPSAPTVGMEGRLEISLPGPTLEARPVDPKAPLLVRVAEARPRGTVVEYDLRYIGLVPGTYDLRTNLVRVDGSSTADLPPMPVKVLGLLPRPHSGELEIEAPPPIPIFGSYTRLMMAAAVFWLVLIVPITLAGRRGRKRVTEAPLPPEPTLAGRLRPLVQQAAAGTLTRDGQAQLERMLLNHWRHRLQIEDLGMAEAVARLREHAEAGALLRELENWLHRRPGQAKVDVEAVLAPYGRLEEPAQPLPDGADNRKGDRSA